MKAEKELWGKDSVVEETVSDAIADIVPGTEAYDPFGSSERK